MDRALGLVLLFIAGIALGGGGVWVWGWSEYSRALSSERDLIGERDSLVRRLADERAGRDKANARAEQERKEVYATDETASAWAAGVVPDSMASRLRDAARAADSATGAAAGRIVPEPAR